MNRIDTELDIGRNISALDADVLREGTEGVLRAADLWEKLNPFERELMGRPAGQLSDAELADAFPFHECLHVLLWALGRLPALLPYGEVLDGPSARAALMLAGDPAAEIPALIAAASLVPSEEVDRAFEIARCWTSRLLLAEERRLSPASLAELAATAVTVGAVPELVDGDLPVRGVPFRELDDEALEALQLTTWPRHRALRWLTGRLRQLDEPG